MGVEIINIYGENEEESIGEVVTDEKKDDRERKNINMNVQS